MIFVLNGVIRSMPKEEAEYELKKMLSGKCLLMGAMPFPILGVSLLKNTLVFSGDAPLRFEQVKKLELSHHEAVIRISTGRRRFAYAYKDAKSIPQ